MTILCVHVCVHVRTCGHVYVIFQKVKEWSLSDFDVQLQIMSFVRAAAVFCMVILKVFFNESWISFSLRFVKEYFSDPRRGYGQVVNVFHKLRAQNFGDPFGPAKEQFGGSGSYGNGGAMRVAPLALFCHSDYNKLINLVQQSAELTHAHKQGYNGTILQVNPQFMCFSIFIMGLILAPFKVKGQVQDEHWKQNNFGLKCVYHMLFVTDTFQLLSPSSSG